MALIYKGIQVKAVSRELPHIPLGKSVDELMGDWWIIVTNAATAEPVCFIMEPDEVKRLDVLFKMIEENDLLD